MTKSPQDTSEMAEAWLALLAAYDADDASDRQTAYRVRELAFGRLYRRERKQHPEWVDLGGEGGEG